MIQRLFKRSWLALIRLLGWSVIGLGALQIIMPWCLPITLDNSKVEQWIKVYYQDLKLGSVHLIWQRGSLTLLLQDVEAPWNAPEKISASRILLKPNIFKSLMKRKLVLKNAYLYGGELDVQITQKTIRFAGLTLPLDLPRDPPVYFQSLNLNKMLVHLQTPNQKMDLTIPEIHLTQTEKRGSFKAHLHAADNDKSWVNIYFDFKRGVEGLEGGKLALEGHDQELNHLFELIEWPGAQVKGLADFQFWATLKGNKVQKGMIDLNGENITLSKPEGEFLLDHFSGRLEYLRQPTHYRWIGHHLNLVHQGRPLSSSEFDLSSSDLETFELKGTQFDLSLIHFILEGNPQVHHTLQSFDLAPQGLVPYVEMTFQRDSMTPTYMLLEAKDLAFKQANLKVQGLNGKFYFENDKIHTQWDGPHLKIENPDWFLEPLKGEDYHIDSQFDLSTQHVQVHAQSTVKSSQVNGSLDLVLQKEPMLDVKLSAPAMALTDVKTLLPVKTMNPALVSWLEEGLLAGQVKGLNFSYYGDLEGLLHLEKGPGFELEADLSHSTIHFADGWPKVQDLNGHLSIKNHGMDLVGQGAIGSSKVQAVVARIPDFRPSPVHVEVQTKVEGPIQDVWDALAHRGLLAEEFHKVSTWQGPMVLDLTLDVPLDTKLDPDFKGTVHLTEASLDHQNKLVDAKKLSGKLNFNQKGLKGEQLQAQWRGYDVKTNLNLSFSKKDPVLNLDLKAKFNPQSLGETYSFMEGFALLEGKLKWHLDQESVSTLDLHGNLKDLAINVPRPLRKPLGEAVPFELHAYFSPQKTVDIQGKLGQKLSGRFKFKELEGELKPEQGVIRLGATKGHSKSKQPWRLEGYAPKLEAQAWFDFLERFSSKDDPILENLGVYLMVDDLIWKNQHIKAMVVDGDFDAKEQAWALELTSPKVQGIAQLPLAPEKPWSFNFSHVYLGKESNLEKSNVQLPNRPLNVNVRRFVSQSLKLKDFNIQLVPHQQGHTINDLSFKTNKTIVEARGVWGHLDQPNTVQLSGQIVTRDAGEFLASFGKPRSIREGRGLARFDLAYTGGLFSPNWASLKGRGEIDLQKGYIKGVNAGFGRLLSLLNVDTIQRRLKLDFNDVTQEGFAFDTLQGHYQIKDGKISTDDLAMKAPTANIEFSGDVTLSSQRVNADLVVMPNVTGSLPLAAAIATGNPAIGAAVWLMNKVVGKKIQELTRYNYTVTGSLDAPNVREVPLQPDRQITRR